jgi:hypothetical protein
MLNTYRYYLCTAASLVLIAASAIPAYSAETTDKRYVRPQDKMKKPVKPATSEIRPREVQAFRPVTISNFRIEPSGSTSSPCTDMVRYTVHNNSSVPTSSKSHLWRKIGQAQWEPYYGQGGTTIPPGESRQTGIAYSWMAPDTWLRVTIHQDRDSIISPVLAEASGKVPYPAAADIQIQDVDIRPDGTTVTVRNNSNMKLCNFTVARSYSTPSEPNKWKPLGGMGSSQGIDANSSEEFVQPRQAGWLNGIARLRFTVTSSVPQAPGVLGGWNFTLAESVVNLN